MSTSSLSWAHLPFHGAHLLLHGHIFPFMGTSSPSLCSHHSFSANRGTYKQTESEAKAKAKAMPNMMINCLLQDLAHAMTEQQTGRK